MNEAHVISVNPGAKTLGELRVNDNRLTKISRTIAPHKIVSRPFKRMLNLLFGISSKVNRQFSGKILLLRIVCCCLLAATALIPLSESDLTILNIPPVAVAMVTAGLSIIFGFFTRLVSLTTACWLAYSMYLSILAGDADMTCGAMIMVMLVFTVLGPGLYSIDRLLLKALLRLTRKRKKKLNSRVDYRAYGIVDRRVC